MLVGKKAPNFSCEAVVNGTIKTIKLDDFKGIKILFFYPSDFTFVCPTELHAFQGVIEEFNKRNVTIIGVSVDSVQRHLEWLAQPKAEGGIKGVTYPLCGDSTKTMAKDYDVLIESEGVTLRALFIIDENNIVQVAQINNLSIGRSTDEALRLVDALIFTKKHGQVCPANWVQGEKAMKATPEGLREYLKK